jgi:hypothetical protein
VAVAQGEMDMMRSAISCKSRTSETTFGTSTQVACGVQVGRFSLLAYYFRQVPKVLFCREKKGKLDITADVGIVHISLIPHETSHAIYPLEALSLSLT